VQWLLLLFADLTAPRPLPGWESGCVQHLERAGREIERRNPGAGHTSIDFGPHFVSLHLGEMVGDGLHDDWARATLQIDPYREDHAWEIEVDPDEHLSGRRFRGGFGALFNVSDPSDQVTRPGFCAARSTAA
jgi:hypothetical protein